MLLLMVMAIYEDAVVVVILEIALDALPINVTGWRGYGDRVVVISGGVEVVAVCRRGTSTLRRSIRIRIAQLAA